jgi:glycosyltransferase involved in cell wall biosynthesis
MSLPAQTHVVTMALVNSLGVVIPTRNSISILPQHAQSITAWMDVADEMVVVDSSSTDGTVEYLREHLPHPRVTFFQHPPGLYQSWNFGIQHISAKYVYIATVGDSITRPGLERLLQVAEEFQSEVVISKPAFMSDQTHPAADIRWPVDDLVDTLAVTRPRTISWLEVLLFTALHLDGTLLGSSASNLYRTDTLQKFPFPGDFGKAGDGAWGARHFAGVKWAVTPEKFSTFLRHPDWTAAAEIENWKTSTRLDKVLRNAVEMAAANGIIPRATLEKYGISELLDTVGQWMACKQAFDQHRARRWPWCLNPAAWKARSRRNYQRRRALQWRHEALARLRTESELPIP